MGRYKVQTAPITCAAEAARAARPAFGRWLGLQECFVVLCLDAQNRVVGKPVVCAVGTAGSVAVAPRDVFREAIKRNACGVILAHNHPSGEVTPSSEDKVLTGRLRSGGELLGVTVLDHIVVSGTGRGYTSFADTGLL